MTLAHKLFTTVNPSILDESGRVFCSGRAAFGSECDLYILGFNPGGDPNSMEESSVRAHSRYVLHDAPDLWSAYSDESWKGRPPGQHGMQPRMLHLFERLGHDPRGVPASNLIFKRAPRAAQLEGDARVIEDLCWQFHAAVLAELRPKVVLCLGNQTGERVRRRLGADHLVGQFVEANLRRWMSTAHRSRSGLTVVSLTHPSIADWTNPASDPTPLVREVMAE